MMLRGGVPTSRKRSLLAAASALNALFLLPRARVSAAAFSCSSWNSFGLRTTCMSSTTCTCTSSSAVERQHHRLTSSARRQYWKSSSSVVFSSSVRDEIVNAAEEESSFDAKNTRSGSERWNSLVGNKTIQSLLVCDDGDLSYSASIAPQLAELGISLTATVLEDQDTHHATYRQSEQHAQTISSYDIHEVRFGINATDLATHFPPSVSNDEEDNSAITYDRIQFNFPHWRGKANNRYNRELLDNFLRSASDFLSDGVGEVHVALCEGQGGGTAQTKKAWRESWKAAEYACMNGLLLRSVSPYEPEYDLSSHRGMDRSFKVGNLPKKYIFSKPDMEADVKVGKKLQLCCRHELHVNLPPQGEGLRSGSVYSIDDVVEGNAIQRIIEGVVDPGIRVEVPMRRVLTPQEAQSEFSVAVFLVIYCGESSTLTRDQADGYRAASEEEVQKHLPLRSNRTGRLVSRPFPYPLLSNLVYHYLQNKD